MQCIKRLENCILDKKVLAIFQPHLFSRTRDFVDDFAKSLSQFDEVLLLDIYPARELPIEGVTSAWLLSKIKNKNKQLVIKRRFVTKNNESKATSCINYWSWRYWRRSKTY